MGYNSNYTGAQIIGILEKAVLDAPSDGNTYLRKNGQWVAIQVANERGAWSEGHYDYYDRVSHSGLWLCVNPEGTDTEPADDNPDWHLEVPPGDTIHIGGDFNTVNTPYAKNTIITFAGHVWINKVETSEAPYPIFTDHAGNRLLYSDGGYVIENETQSEDWILLI